MNQRVHLRKTTADASSTVGMKGMRMVSTLEGKCVNTIVFTSPNLLAIHLRACVYLNYGPPCCSIVPTAAAHTVTERQLSFYCSTFNSASAKATTEKKAVIVFAGLHK